MPPTSVIAFIGAVCSLIVGSSPEGSSLIVGSSPEGSSLTVVSSPEGSSLVHQSKYEVLLQHRQPLVHIKVSGHGMVGGQRLGPVRADVEHRAQREPHVVDGGRPGVRVVLGEFELNAALRACV